MLSSRTKSSLCFSLASFDSRAPIQFTPLSNSVPISLLSPIRLLFHVSFRLSNFAIDLRWPDELQHCGVLTALSKVSGWLFTRRLVFDRELGDLNAISMLYTSHLEEDDPNIMSRRRPRKKATFLSTESLLQLIPSATSTDDSILVFQTRGKQSNHKKNVYVMRDINACRISSSVSK